MSYSIRAYYRELTPRLAMTLDGPQDDTAIFRSCLYLTKMRKFRVRTVSELADMICGNESPNFIYRSSTYLSEFFADCDMEKYVHDGSTRKWWVASTLEDILKEPSDISSLPGVGFRRVIDALMDLGDHTGDDPGRQQALGELNITLAREGLEAFYGEDRQCHLRNTQSGEHGVPSPTIGRALTKEEADRGLRLESFLNLANEESITEAVVVPLLQTLGFHRVSAAGHRDRGMEFGKDLWMKFRLPTGHWIYFGLQVKRRTLDAAAKTRNDNIAEVHRQVMMMLGHAIFDPDINKRRLIDHAIVVSCGEVTKQAKQWIGERLDASQRSQILFMERSDIVHLFAIHNLRVPGEDENEEGDDISF